MSPLQERFLRHIWSRQEFVSLPLRTTDGRILEVFTPGTLNLGSGPDFLQARIRIGGTVYVGDIEFHRTPADWDRHNHARDPHYDHVILHVVLEATDQNVLTRTSAGRSVPIVDLTPHLAQQRLRAEHQSLLDERFRIAQTIACADLNYSIPARLLERLLTQMGSERLRMKERRMEERLSELAADWSRSCGEQPATAFSQRALWEQVLYEGLMDALGYTRNRTPFIRLAQSVTLDVVARQGIVDVPLLVEAFLFGAGGLIPVLQERTDESLRLYVDRLEAAWRSMQQRFRGELLHVDDWCFAPTRPANGPLARVLQAARLVHALMRRDLFPELIAQLSAETSGDGRVRSVKKLLRLPAVSPLAQTTATRLCTGGDGGWIGENRIDEMTVNIIVPFGLLYARVFRDQTLPQKIIELLNVLPASEGNAVTRLLEGHLVRGKIPQSTAIIEQGMIQLFRFSCSRERCRECDVGRALGLG